VAKEKQEANEQNWKFPCQNRNRRNGQEKLKTDSVSAPASWSPNSDRFRVFLTKMGIEQEKAGISASQDGNFAVLPSPLNPCAHATPTAMFDNVLQHLLHCTPTWLNHNFFGAFGLLTKIFGD